jgi:serine/threonine protein kinase
MSEDELARQSDSDETQPMPAQHAPARGPLPIIEPTGASASPSHVEPGASKSGESQYAVELPLPQDLQAMLGGAYVVEGFVGQGGMGAVYKGVQLPLRRPVAIKILRKGAGAKFGFEERFKREADTMASLTHPHIVQVHDCGDAGRNFLFICMELVGGGDLGGLLKRGEMPQERAVRLVMEICEALQFSHERGVVHRDIKPTNILLTNDGHVKVADFGLAKHFGQPTSFVTQSGLSMGTPGYAAPEQLGGAGDVDHRADVYSLGVMLYQMLTGWLPRGAYRPPSARAHVDERLDAVVFKAMEHDRADRYQSAAEFKAALAAIVGTLRGGAATSPGRNPGAPSLQAVAPERKRHFPSRAVAAGVILALLAGGAWLVRLEEPGAKSSSAPSGEGWTPLFTEAEWKSSAPGTREHMDGHVHLRRARMLKAQTSADGAIRARIRYEEQSRNVGVVGRGATPTDLYKLELADGRNLGLVALVTRFKTYDSYLFGGHSLPAPLRPGDTLVLELRIEGDRLTALLNNHVVMQARDGRFKNPGEWGIMAEDGWYESVEVRPLSPGPEAGAETKTSPGK